MAVTHRQQILANGSDTNTIDTGVGLNFSGPLVSTDVGKIVVFIISIRNVDGIGTPFTDFPTLNGVDMTLLSLSSTDSNTSRSAIFYLKTADVPSSGTHAVSVQLTSAKNVHYTCATLVAGNTSEINILDFNNDPGVQGVTNVVLDPTGKIDTTLLVYDHSTLFDSTDAITASSGQTSLGTIGSMSMRVGLKSVTDATAFAQRYTAPVSQETIGQALLLDSAASVSHDLAASIDAAWNESGAIVPQKFFQSSIDAGWTDSGVIAGGIKNFAASMSAAWNLSGSIDGQIRNLGALIDAGWTESSLDLDKDILLGASINAGWTSAANLAFDFSFKWSIEHLEASTSHGFPSVYVQVSNIDPPTGTFNDLSGTVFERRLLEMPRLQEVQLDDRSGLAGFQRVTLQADNSDGLLNGLDLQDSYVRMFFVDADGNDYKEFNGKVVDWTLSHTVTINVEDLDALAFTQELPKRTLNDLVEAEKVALTGQEPALTEFRNSVIADDLGKPIPIVFGRAVKVPLLYVKADETLVMDESKREYDYIIGEGIGLDDENFKEVFTVYRDEQALDNWSFDTPSMGTTTTVPLSIGTGGDPDLRRPDGWYKYWWIFGGDEIRYVTEYDSLTNTVTLDSALPLAVPNNFPIELREWRFYNGSQTSPDDPYAGYAFIRFKKRLGTVGRTDDLYADVNGLGGGDDMSVPDGEVNRVRAVESILSNPDWGLGLAVDSTSFSNAATRMLAISDFTCEGAILNQTTATDIFQKLLSFRDMVLYKEGSIKISVDGEKLSSNFNFGLGDETGNNNILNASPSIVYKHPNEKVKDLKVRYRRNHRENDTFLHEFTRSSSTRGVDETLDLPFVYDHDTADMALDYRRKRQAAADRTLSLDVGEDGKKARRGNLVTVDIPSLGVSSDWEIVSSNVTPAGSNTVNLVPYSASSYSYTSFDSEGGTLPIDPEFGVKEPFDIPPDFTNTPPEPVTAEVATPGFEVQDDLTRIGYIDVTWTPPVDGNYLEGKVKTKISSAADSTYIEHPHGFDRVRATPLKVGLTYDLLVSSVNVNNLESYALPITGIFIPGDDTIPKIPQNVIGKGKFNKVSWEWDAVTENADLTPIEDLKGYEYRVWSASSNGTQLYPKDQTIGFTTDTRVEITDSDGDLTTNDRTLYFEVRAIDDSGNVSGYTMSRVDASTGEVTRPDARNNDFNKQYTAMVNGPIDIGISGHITLVSIPNVQLLDGQTAFIDFNVQTYLTFLDSAGWGTFFEIRRNGIRISPATLRTPVMSDLLSRYRHSFNMEDSPGAGTYIYSVTIFGETDHSGFADSISLLINEHRR